MKVKKVSKTLTDIDRESAMKYVVKRGYGYMKELTSFDEVIISEMKQIGFLKTGWTMDEETFSATDSLLNYVKAVFKYEPKRGILRRLSAIFCLIKHS